jgi:LysM repeat protein
MRVRTWSACVALAWGILLIMTAAGPIGSPRPAQATTRIASTTSNTSTSTSTQVTLTSSVTTTPTINPSTTPATTTGAGIPDLDTRAGAGTYVVQPGDTLSGIAAALGSTGGWPALYAANQRAIGNNPALIRPGLVLTLPGRPMAAVRYTIAPGDTLSRIAAALGSAGGWPALYAANRRVIGPDPDVIRAGTVLAIPHSGLPARPPLHQVPTASPAPHRTAQPAESAPVTAPSGRPTSARPLTGARPNPRSAQATSMGGLPRWLEIVLVAAGLLIATAFLTEPVLALARRRRAVRPAAADAHIVLADYERLVVTHSRADGTVYVLRPPGVDPQAILLAARLVLAQDRYEALAGHLGVPAHWPTE